MSSTSPSLHKGNTNTARPASTSEKVPASPTTSVDCIKGTADPDDADKTKDVQLDEDWQFPEGGYGWVVVGGFSLIMFVTLGLSTSWEVFQEYYQANLLKDHSPSDIAWIGSVQYSLIFFPGLIAGRLFDLGHFHVSMAVASALLIIGSFLVAECTTYWQLMLTQGLIIGIAGGFLFGPGSPLISHWFRRRRATAYGVTTGCGATGSVVLPIAIRNLIPMIGFKWTMRLVGFIDLLALGIANSVLRARLPPKSVKGSLFNIAAFKSAPYALLVAALFTAYMGLYTTLTYVDVAGVAIGLDPKFTFYLVPIANAGSFFGRLIAGVLSDRFGPYNMLILFGVVAAITTFVWPYCFTKGSLIVLVIFNGTAAGAFVSLSPAPIALLDTANLGQRTGMMFTIMAIGALVGPPISGAIHQSVGGFKDSAAYAGSMLSVSCILLVCSRRMASIRLAQIKRSK
ncbi:hypothetical protein BOTBODRAFT_37275 [Botryobasidium botryosum FD-172 SS1]|uniref:Major facilitator superfamily (MFS) profile domain-containing protein n=1 Tax=Botryobasidium botryosum (strain FD-172 SS1) TaxID=930990 RepID=A0A067M396_BOTB1|nr:hypothetical protein BOTBODRAFT_37275 [Botryobasidium botryosum FD-172 SS1]